nr:MAG: hypothetical protein 1 [Barnaviridae sp.]
MNSTGLLNSGNAHHDSDESGSLWALIFVLWLTILVGWPVVRATAMAADFARTQAIRLGWVIWGVSCAPIRWCIERASGLVQDTWMYVCGFAMDFFHRSAPIEVLNFINNGEFVYECGKPCIRFTLDDVTRFVDISPFLALHMHSRVGPESAIAGSMYMDVKEQPNGSFSLWNNEIFVGCANRVIIDGRKYIVTAKHVYDALVEGCVYAQYKHRRSPVTLQPLVRPDNLDVVVCRDNQIVHFWGVRAQKAVPYSNVMVTVTGTPDGVNWKKAQGTTAGSRPFRFTHTASTMPGYSGMPVTDAAGRTIGVHTGSVKRDGVVVNEGVAVVDLIRAFLRHVKGKTMESYEEYDKPAWGEDNDTFDYTDDVEEIAIEYENKSYRMTAGKDSFTWKPWDPTRNWGDEESEEELDETHYFESAQADFQMGLVTSATKISVQTASPVSSKEPTTLSKSQRKNRARRLRRKATACSRSVGKETALSPLVTTGTVRLPTATSLRPATSSGPTDLARDSSSPLRTTARSLNKTGLSQLPQREQALLQKLSVRCKPHGRSTVEQKVDYLLTRQHQPTRPLTPAQLELKENLLRFQMDYPTHFESEYRAARSSARSHAKSS